jgi:hypothetical protein
VPGLECRQTKKEERCKAVSEALEHPNAEVVRLASHRFVSALSRRQVLHTQPLGTHLKARFYEPSRGRG